MTISIEWQMQTFVVDVDVFMFSMQTLSPISSKVIIIIGGCVCVYLIDDLLALFLGKKKKLLQALKRQK